jgi:hypothetical protein
VKLSDINLLDPNFFVERAPHEWFTHLCQHAPAYRHPESGGGHCFWVFTRYKDVVAIGRYGQIFSSGQARGGVVTLDDSEARPKGRKTRTNDAHYGCT